MTQSEPRAASHDNWTWNRSEGLAARIVAAPYSGICSTVLLFLILSIGLRLTVAGFTLTPERLVGLASIALSPAWFLSRRRIRSSPRFVDHLYFAWLVWIAGVTLVSLPLSAALRGLAPLLLAAIFYLAPRYVPFLSPRSLADARVSIASTIVFGLGGIVSFALSDPGPRRASFTVLEPNLYGAVMAFLSLLAVRNFDRRRPWLSTAVLLLAHLGLLLGFSRGPWLGYVIGLIVYVVFAKRHYLSVRHLNRKTLSRVAAVIVACAVFILIMGPLTHVFDYISPAPAPAAATTAPPAAAPAVEGTSNQVDGILDSQTIGTRMTLWRLAWEDVRREPVTGSGALSFSHYHLDVLPQIGGDSPHNVWISNIVLGVLHDSGIVGLLLALGFCVTLLVKGIRTAWPAGGTLPGTAGGEKGGGAVAAGQRKEVAALWLAISLALLVVSQTTSMVTLGFLWLALGCLSYAVAAERTP